MSQPEPLGRLTSTASDDRRLHLICAEFEARWNDGRPPRIEDFLVAAQAADRTALFCDLLAVELGCRARLGDRPTPDDYRDRFAEYAGTISALFDHVRQSAPEDRGDKEPLTWPGAATMIGQWRESTDPLAEVPAAIGRYAVRKRLGRGGFGLVYLAHDESLDRQVAVKVPHASRMSPEYAKVYLAEARTVANLDHPHIVPIYDVGSTEQFPCYLVSKYMEGGDLSTRLKQCRLSFSEAAGLVASVADALHYAHTQGIVHRDIKPGNILLDKGGKPFVSDFGLALREEDLGKGPRRAGTPAYMSPEQARGEGHRVDGRSDIFSLGVVLYELLTRRRPFPGDSRSELLEQITNHEPRPPRQVDDGIPKELERICLKALAKRTSERYSTAIDLTDDLRHFLARQSPEMARSEALEPELPTAITPAASARASSAGGVSGVASESLPIRIVPKGLRSFDEHDADFFLELLPGPRDREGLPDSIRFWKTRVEETDGDRTFSVGVIYGPSGCGKSSLVRAGLLPRLSQHVAAVYLEASVAETETRLLGGLRKCCPELPDHLNLKETLAVLRQGRRLPAGKKVLIVLDQFEQWLYAKQEELNSELVQALRQCDGAHVQCVVMVRDDFWLAISRFMTELEVDLVPGRNIALVDLFDPQHARKVLTALGRAWDRLPQERRESTQEHEEFLKQAVNGLAQEGKVIGVRLALFAEMMKGKPWTPATLKEVGGMRGLGITFLEETFSSSTANPKHRLHQKAARSVLKALLPQSGADIKGHRRSEAELLAASGYERRPREFAELLRILDADLRLITPADGDEPRARSAAQAPRLAAPGDEEPPSDVDVPSPAPRSYQLTHDYLVHSLRGWLTRKQRETRRGRAELRLDETTSAWSRARDSRFLPSLPEFLSIVSSVPRNDLSPEQKSLLGASARRHASRWGAGVLAAVVLGVCLQQFVAWERGGSHRKQAETLADSLLPAPSERIAEAIEGLRPFFAAAAPRLRARLADATAPPLERLHAAEALAAHGEYDQEFLLRSIADAPAAECRNLVAALRVGGRSAREELSRRVEEERDVTARARYAIVLLHLGDPRGAAEVLAPADDPKYRTALIHTFAHWHADVHDVMESLRANDNSAFRSGMCAALGIVTPNELLPEERGECLAVLRALATTAPDGGTHSAARFALMKWNEDLPAVEVPTSAPANSGWFVTPHQLTMVRIEEGDYVMGGAEVNDAPPHHVQLTRPFFMSDCEVSLGLFQQFMENHDAGHEPPRDWTAPSKMICPDPACPVVNVSWVDAVLFCNWLSQSEGRKVCYRRVPAEGESSGAPDGELESESWSVDFDADGFRLPTEAEWEYACRAGTTTRFSFGNVAEHFASYDVCGRDSKGRTWPVGARLPNAWGLFDMHGNAAEWCGDWFASFDGEAVDPKGPPQGTARVVRWGAYNVLPEEACQAALRLASSPARSDPAIGFRIVCKCPRQP